MTFRRALGTFDATMMVIGGIIGAGIFINPSVVAQRLDSPALVLAAWAAGGAMALAGAFAYGELAAILPRAGGQYVYLSRAYHPLAGFLYGWALLLIIESGAIAAVAITCAQYTLRFAGRSDAAVPLVAIAAIVIVSVVNFFGVKPGSRLLNVFVVLKVVALAALIAAGFLLPDLPATTAVAAPAIAAGGGVVVAFGAALVPILFTYGGWQQTNFVAEEVERAERTLPRALFIGTVTVVAVYLLVNVVYLRALGHAGLAASLTPAADASARAFGSRGDTFIAAAIAISTFGFLDVAVLTASRVYYAMAADGMFLGAVGRLHPRFGTPWLAILIQGVWSVVLLLTGTYGQLLDYVVFADWIFFGLSVAAVFIFRRTMPLSARPPGSFRSPGYPIVPALFVIVSAAVVLSVIWSNPARSAMGALLLAIGVPVFWYQRRRVRSS